METGIGSPRCIHLICSPQRCIDEVFKLSALPKQTWGGEELDTIIVWEPVPDLCTPENREAMLQAAMMVDVVSPNHEELLGFFADEKLGENAVEGLANRIQVGNHGQGHMVVRAGKKGCYVRAGKSTDFMVTTNGLKKWLPAYHEVVEGKKSESVVDPTGGGNTFIGGMCQALARGIEIDRAAAMGNVAASFAIEQIGLPVLQVTDDGELWNGEQVKDRMEKYLWRIEGKKA